MKKLISIAIAVVMLTSVAGARTASDFFVSSPLIESFMVDSITRLDMLDYYRAGSSVPSKNFLDGNALVMSEKPEKIELQVCDSVWCSLSVVTSAPSDTVLCVIKTVSLPMKDSSIDFYDTSWKPLARKVFTEPGIEQWFPDKRVREKAREQLPFITVQYDYNPETLTLIAVPTIKSYFHQNYMPSSVELLPPSLEYRWTGKNFKPVKH